MAQHPVQGPCHCEWCPQDWDCSPEHQVACPSCHAAAGHPCMRPSGHTTWDIHATRHQAALDAGIINPQVCRGLCFDDRKHRQGPTLRAAVITRLLAQFPGQDTVPWAATYAAVDYILGHAAKAPPPKNKQKKTAQVQHSYQPQLFELEAS